MKKNFSGPNEIEHDRLVRRDFFHVIVLNLLLLGLMLGLFFWNRSTGQLENIFSSIINF